MGPVTSRFAPVRPERGGVPAVDWPRARGGVPAGWVPLGVVARVAGVGRAAAYKLARRCHAEGRVRLVNRRGADSCGRRRVRVCVPLADGAYLVAVHRAAADPASGPNLKAEPCPAGYVLVADVARAAGVDRRDTARLARRQGVVLHVERGRDRLGRARRRLVVYAGDADRLAVLHRARAERRPG